MKIKFLCRRFIAGEAWTNRVLAYAKGLVELGCEIELYFLISDKSRNQCAINIPGVRVINLWEYDNFLERKFRILSYLHNLLRFRRILKTGDKVFIYGAEKNLVNASSIKGVDVYVEITEHPYIYNKHGIDGEKQIDKESLKLNKLKGIAVISFRLREYFKSIGINEKKLCVSNMFVDSKRFDIPKDQNIIPYIAYCGVISVNKDGVDTLLKSFYEFRKKYPNYKLHIIGRYESEMVKKTLDKLVLKLRIKDDVVFTGQIKPEEMPKLLVNASMLALARPDNLQAQNGFPTKLGEYLSTGNPVVVTSVGEIPLFIKDGYNGYLVAADNPIAFAEKLKYIADNYDESLEVAKRGRVLANTDFSYKSQSRVLYELMNR